MRGLRIAAWSVAATTVGLLVVLALRLLGVVHGPAEDPVKPIYWAVWALLLVVVLTPTFIGLGIVLRRPRNVIGWIMLVGGLTVIAPMVGEVVGNPWGLQASRATWPLLYAWPIAIAYVFPNGRLLTPRWRWIA